MTRPTQPSELTYLGNVLNETARRFLPAARRGQDRARGGNRAGAAGRKVMTTKHCIKHQLGWCPKENKTVQIQEPLALVDEQGNHFPLRFNCARCEMEVYFQTLERSIRISLVSHDKNLALNFVLCLRGDCVAAQTR